MKRPLTTPEEFFAEAIRYYRNAKEILRKVTIKYGLYEDPKLVGEACGTAYRGVLHAVEGYLIQFGWEPEKLPDDVTEIRKALGRTAQKNGKLMVQFNIAYERLHITGYYKETRDIEYAKLAMASARWIIEHLSGRRL